MDLGTRQMRAARFGPYGTGELTLARQLVADLQAGLLVLLDRNFLAYDLLWNIVQRESGFLVRVKGGVKVRLVCEFAPGDRLVEIEIPRRWRKLRPDMPRTWTLREICYTPEGGKEEIRLFTTLLDPEEVAAEELAACYHERWSEETGIEEIKTRLGNVTTITRPALLRSRTPSRVEQEVWALLIAYNIVRVTMVRASESVPQSPEPTRLSFTAAMHQLRDGARDMMLLATWRLIDHYEQLLRTIANAVVPLRPGRVYPRAVKVKMSGYPLNRTARPAA
jgi:hypothetical protein